MALYPPHGIYIVPNQMLTRQYRRTSTVTILYTGQDNNDYCCNGGTVYIL